MISLCGDTIGGDIRATDKQVKFLPENFEQAYDLLSDLNIVFEEYNINTEIIKMGDYYHN